MALRGRSLSGVVLDEAAFMESAVWFEVIRPALADKQGWAVHQHPGWNGKLVLRHVVLCPRRHNQ